MSLSATSSVVSFIQAPLPTGFSSYLANAPTGASLNCFPSPSTVTALATLLWEANSDGCPQGYSYSSLMDAGTCVYTSSKAVDFTWNCDYFFPVSTNSNINEALTATNILPRKVRTTDYVAVSKTSASPESTFAPAVHKRQDKNIDHRGGPNLFVRQDLFMCDANDYYCPVGSACVGGATGKSCCASATLICVDYSPKDMFLKNMKEHVTINTLITTPTASAAATTILTPDNTALTSSFVINSNPTTTMNHASVSASHWPDADQSLNSPPSGHPAQSVKLGAGVGIPLGFAAIFGFSFFMYRRNKASREEANRRQALRIEKRKEESVPVAGKNSAGHWIDGGLEKVHYELPTYYGH